MQHRDRADDKPFIWSSARITADRLRRAADRVEDKRRPAHIHVIDALSRRSGTARPAALDAEKPFARP